jgi:hypothetical protein
VNEWATFSNLQVLLTQRIEVHHKNTHLNTHPDYYSTGRNLKTYSTADIKLLECDDEPTLNIKYVGTCSLSAISCHINFWSFEKWGKIERQFME